MPDKTCATCGGPVRPSDIDSRRAMHVDSEYYCVKCSAEILGKDGGARRRSARSINATRGSRRTSRRGAGAPVAAPPRPSAGPASEGPAAPIRASARAQVQPPRKTARSSRREAGASVPDDDDADVSESQRVRVQADAKQKQQKQMLIFGGIGGGVLLILIIVIIAVAASDSNEKKRNAAAQKNKTEINPKPIPGGGYTSNPQPATVKIDRTAELRALYKKRRDAERRNDQDAIHDCTFKINQIKRSTDEQNTQMWEVIKEEEAKSGY
jgi:hypothetical protein